MSDTLSIDSPVARPIATHDVQGAGGVRLHVREWGNPEGPPIVFVHGWSQSDLCWSRQTAGRLAREFRLVSFDLRGHGLSEKPLGREHYGDAALWAADLHAVLEGSTLEPAVLVAWSYGAFVATDYVRAYGESRVAALNLVGGSVLLTSSFDHIGPGFLENAPDACAPDLATNIAAICRFLSVCTRRPLATDDWAAALA
jgi:non-heme chloroperoxidase